MSNTVPVASKPFIFRKKSIIAGRVESNAAKTSACRNKLTPEAVEKMFKDFVNMPKINRIVTVKFVKARRNSSCFCED